MRNVSLWARLALPLAAGLFGGQTFAADGVEYGEGVLGPHKRVVTVQALGPDAYGESVSTYTGGLSFTHTDLSLPGNSGLPVAVTRSLTVDGNKSPNQPNDSELWRGYAFGEWELDLPYLSGIYAESQGWHVSTTSPNARCSSPTTLAQFRPKNLPVGEVYFSYYSYWNGNSLSLPGQGEQKLLFRPSGSTIPSPATGTWTSLTTASHWRFACLSTLASGQPGEGFLALAPDGSKYTFNWMVSYPERPLRGRGQIILATGGSYWVYEELPRREYRLYPTRIEDRFGNYVTYTWSGSNLTAITASDGRSLNLTYTSGKISSITDGTRTVSYTYTNGLLSAVTLPDSSAWAMDTSAVVAMKRFVPLTDPNPWDFPMDCQRMRRLTGEEADLVITHPSGAVGRFTLAYQRHYRTNLAGSTMSCPALNMGDVHPPLTAADDKPLENTRYDVLAVKRKTTTGPALPTLVWEVAHADTYSMAPGYPTQGTRTVTETRPDGSSVVSVFGTDSVVNEGQLLSTEIRQGSTVLSRTENAYVQNSEISGMPFPTWVGEPLFYEFHRGRSDYTRPLKSSLVKQGGVGFSLVVDEFDVWARQVQVTKSSAPLP